MTLAIATILPTIATKSISTGKHSLSSDGVTPTFLILGNILRG
jgi:hypothetical protein